MKRSLPPGPRRLRHHPLPGRGAAVLLHSSSCFLSQPLMLSTLGLNLDHFKAWIKTDLQVSAAPIFGARGLFTTVVFFNLQLWIQKEQKHVVMSCRYEPHAQLSSTPLQATPFQICFPIRADNSNRFLYRLPSNTTAEDGHSFSKPEATDVRLIIQKLFYLTELKKAFKMLAYMNKLVTVVILLIHAQKVTPGQRHQLFLLLFSLTDILQERDSLIETVY